jgi:prophage antirepressor-like protein
MDVKTFKTPEVLGSMDIRVGGTAQNPTFVTADVARALGSSNASTTAQNVPADEKGIDVVKTPGGPQRLSYLTEAGLYRVLMRSNSPKARPFQDWVVKVVLPAIRKDGGYIVGEEKVRTGEMSPDELMARAVLIAQNKIERLTTERDQLASQNAVLAPKAAVVDQTFVGDGTRLRDLLRTLDGVDLNAAPSALGALGDLWRDNRGRYRVKRSTGADRFFHEKWQPVPGYAHRLVAITVTKAGVERITRYYEQGKLPMKKTYQQAA